MMEHGPTQDDVLAYFDSLSNWGRWGNDDQRGTLNYITPDARRRGASAVRHGVSVSCAWNVEEGPNGIQRTTQAHAFSAEHARGESLPGYREDTRWGSSSESLAYSVHGQGHTHVDGLCHIFWDGHMYNGRPADLVNPGDGATWGAVTAAADGMVTRGILLDVPRLRGEPWMTGSEGVFPDELEAAEQRQGVRVEPGDAVLLRTGYGRYHREFTGPSLEKDYYHAHPGWHAACLPWLHERQVAYIGSDVGTDLMPSEYPNIFLPVHSVGIVAMGLWLIDNCDLEACAATADELGQWTFNLSVCPNRFAATTGSPVNPIATF